MGTQHYARKTTQGHKGRQRSGGKFEDEDRAADRKPKIAKSTSNRRHPERDEEGRLTDDRPSEGRGSNFGDDEIGGTSFDPRPAQSQENQRNLRRK